MKKNLTIFFLIGAVMTMSSANGEENTYASFVSRDSSVSMNYPDGWKTLERVIPKENLLSVLFIENKDGDACKAKMSFTAEKFTGERDLTLTLSFRAKDLIEKRGMFKNFKLVSQTESKVGHCGAEEVVVIYDKTDKIYAIDAKQVTFKEKILLWEKGDTLYVFRYENTEQDFDKYSAAFDHIVKTLRF